MTLHEEQERVQKAVSHSLAYVQEDPWLAQRVLANAKGEEPVVKKISTSMILVTLPGDYCNCGRHHLQSGLVVEQSK